MWSPGLVVPHISVDMVFAQLSLLLPSDVGLIFCRPENGYDTESCWNTEIEEYVADDNLLPLVKQCISDYFKDISHDPPSCE